MRSKFICKKKTTTFQCIVIYISSASSTNTQQRVYKINSTRENTAAKSVVVRQSNKMMVKKGMKNQQPV